MVKNHLPMQKMRVPSLGWEDPLKKSMATHSSIQTIPWEIPWTEEPGGLQSMELHRVGHDLATKQQCVGSYLPNQGLNLKAKSQALDCQGSPLSGAFLTSTEMAFWLLCGQQGQSQNLRLSLNWLNGADNCRARTSSQPHFNSIPRRCLVSGGKFPLSRWAPAEVSGPNNPGVTTSSSITLPRHHSWGARNAHGGPHVVMLQVVVAQSLRPHGLQPTRLPCPWDSPGKNTSVDCLSLLQGISLTQGLNLGLWHCRQILSHLSHQGSPHTNISMQGPASWETP